MQRVVRSVINITEQTQGPDLSFVPQTTKFILTQPFHTAKKHYPANSNETPQMTSIRGCHQDYVGQTICIETALGHTWTIK